jgi:hypothetical protein
VYPGYHPRPRRRWLRWALAYVVGVLLVAVIGLVIEAAVTHRPPRAFPSVPSSLALGTPPAASPGSAPKPTNNGGTSPLSGPLQVVRGRETVNGVWLGFPHSAAGAVSAADDLAGEVFSTLDPDRAAAVMRLTAAPSYPDAPAEAAHGAAEDRQALGLPASGPVPAGYSLVVQPAEYQARDVTADQATVLLLCDFTTTRPGEGTQTRVAVFPVRMLWAQADWKVASFGTGSDAGLAAEPFSARAAGLGWQELLPQEAASAR